MSKAKIGKLGGHSHGKLDETDEGDLRMRIAADYKNQVVLVDFGTPVVWLGLPKSEALGLADLLRKHADKLD